MEVSSQLSSDTYPIGSIIGHRHDKYFVLHTIEHAIMMLNSTNSNKNVNVEEDEAVVAKF